MHAEGGRILHSHQYLTSSSIPVAASPLVRDKVALDHYPPHLHVGFQPIIRLSFSESVAGTKVGSALTDLNRGVAQGKKRRDVTRLVTLYETS